MSKTYYSEYARHCLRFYIRHPNPKFECVTDRKDWFAARDAVESLKDDEQEFINNIYTSYVNEISERVKNAADDMNFTLKKAWGTMCIAEKRVAKNRGLIC